MQREGVLAPSKLYLLLIRNPAAESEVDTGQEARKGDMCASACACGVRARACVCVCVCVDRREGAGRCRSHCNLTRYISVLTI